MYKEDYRGLVFFIFYAMNKFLLSLLLCLVSLASAGDEVKAYFLDKFIQGNGRIPNKCVQNGETYKCEGYAGLPGGIIFNTKTRQSIVYSKQDNFEVYGERKCNLVYVNVFPNQDEFLVCDKMDPAYFAVCLSQTGAVMTQKYDESGALLGRKVYELADPGYCLNKFNFQFGNDGSKVYNGMELKKTQPKGSLGDDPVSVEFNNVLKKVAGFLIPAEPEPAGDAGEAVEESANSGSIPSESDVTVSGRLSLSDVMKVVRQRTPALQRIYGKYAKKNPGFGGVVTLKLVISPKGAVSKISVAESTTDFAAFDKEVKGAVNRWKFGKVKSGNTTVTIPFSFGE